jgi:Cu+-exporting ATPase
MRSFLFGIALFAATPAFACPMADAAAFADASAKVQAASGTKLTLAVEGLTCGDCANKVMAALGGVQGVVASAVDYQTGRTEVAFDSAKVKPETLIAAIKKLGYKATVSADVFGS